MRQRDRHCSVAPTSVAGRVQLVDQLPLRNAGELDSALATSRVKYLLCDISTVSWILTGTVAPPECRRQPAYSSTALRELLRWILSRRAGVRWSPGERRPRRRKYRPQDTRRFRPDTASEGY